MLSRDVHLLNQEEFSCTPDEDLQNFAYSSDSRLVDDHQVEYVEEDLIIPAFILNEDYKQLSSSDNILNDHSDHLTSETINQDSLKSTITNGFGDIPFGA
jgi:hypothetical protein